MHLPQEFLFLFTIILGKARLFLKWLLALVSQASTPIPRICQSCARHTVSSENQGLVVSLQFSCAHSSDLWVDRKSLVRRRIAATSPSLASHPALNSCSSCILVARSVCGSKLLLVEEVQYCFRLHKAIHIFLAVLVGKGGEGNERFSVAVMMSGGQGPSPAPSFSITLLSKALDERNLLPCRGKLAKFMGHQVKSSRGAEQEKEAKKVHKRNKPALQQGASSRPLLPSKSLLKPRQVGRSD